jgi:hypothetical protein
MRHYVVSPSHLQVKESDTHIFVHSLKTSFLLNRDRFRFLQKTLHFCKPTLQMRASGKTT